MPPPTSKITTDLVPDDPLVQRAGYRFDAAERQRLDAQIVGTQRHLAESLINGSICTWAYVDASAATVVAGDVAVLKASSARAAIVRASGAALTAAGRALGVVVSGAAPGTRARLCVSGVLPPSVTGLAAGAAGPVRVSSSGRLERVATLTGGDYPVGHVDAAGYLTLAPERAYDGGSSPTYTQIATACASATSPLALNGQRHTNVGDPVDDQDVATKAYVDTAVAGVGGAPSRIVALDANDIIEWNLDETGAPWVDSISGVNLVGYDNGNPSYTPLISYGGSIFGARAPHANWQLDHGFESAATIVGENEYGTVHGWVRPTYTDGGTVFMKNETVPGPYVRFGPIDSTNGTAVYAGIGDSGDYDMLPTPAKSRLRGLVTVGQWSHVAMTWGGGEAFVYLNGVLLPTTITYSSLGWNGGKWRLGKWTGNMSAHFSKWRVCNVARTAAYIDEVQRRAMGRWP